MSKAFLNPKTDIPDQSGRVFLITGGTTGLGASSIQFIASHSPAHIFSGRNKACAADLITKVREASPSTKLTFIECDLSSLSSVKEIQFATNYLGHAFLIESLLPCLLKTAEQPNSDVRIVNVPSSAHEIIPNASIEFNRLKTLGANYGPFYQPNKWIITSVAIHPGFIKTALHDNNGLADRVVVNLLADKWVSEEEGTYSQTWAATTAKANLSSGAYYEPVGVKTTPKPKQAKDMGLVRELWEWEESELEKWT